MRDLAVVVGVHARRGSSSASTCRRRSRRPARAPRPRRRSKSTPSSAVTPAKCLVMPRAPAAAAAPALAVARDPRRWPSRPALPGAAAPSCPGSRTGHARLIQAGPVKPTRARRGMLEARAARPFSRDALEAGDGRLSKADRIYLALEGGDRLAASSARRRHRQARALRPLRRLAPAGDDRDQPPRLRAAGADRAAEGLLRRPHPARRRAAVDDWPAARSRPRSPARPPAGSPAETLAAMRAQPPLPGGGDRRPRLRRLPRSSTWRSTGC